MDFPAQIQLHVDLFTDTTVTTRELVANKGGESRVEHINNLKMITQWSEKVLFMMLLSLVAVEHAFAGVPCTIDYKSYKNKLFEENWRPVPTSKNYGINSEASSGNQFASAIWQKRETNESIRIVMRWEHGNLCVLPQHSALQK